MLPLGACAVTVGFGLLIAFAGRRWTCAVAGPRAVGPGARGGPARRRGTCPCCARSTRGCARWPRRSAPRRWRTWRTVDCRARPALGVGAGFAAAVSLGEFGATSFLARAARRRCRSDRPAAVASGRGQRGQRRRCGLLVVVTGRRVLADRPLAHPSAGGAVSDRRSRDGGLAVARGRAQLGGAPSSAASTSGRPAGGLALLGPSGAGKSTLLRAIAGLADADPGYVRWDGIDLAGCRPTGDGRAGVPGRGAVPAPGRRRNVAYGLAAAVSRAPSAGRVEELLALVDLAGYDVAGRDPVGRTGATGGPRPGSGTAPRLLLLDEPFGALDRELRDRLAVDVRDLLHRLGTPAVHVTHDSPRQSSSPTGWCGWCHHLWGTGRTLAE